MARKNRKEKADSRRFINTLAAVFIGAILAFPLFTPFNQVMLILPVMLLLQDWKALPRFSRIVFTGAVSWPWIVSAILLFFPPQLNPPSQLPMRLSFLVSFTPLALALVLMTRSNSPSQLGNRVFETS
jgi:hypothetical protein